MKYAFANYPTGKRVLRIGKDTLEINEGIAEVDELNAAQVTLAEVYEGKPVPPIALIKVEQRPSPIKVKHQTFVQTIIEQKRILITAFRILNSQLRGVRLGNGSK